MLVTPYLTVAGFNRLVPREKQIVNRFLKKVYEGLFNVYKRWKGPKPVSVYDQKMKDFQAKKKAEEEKKARELAAQN
jgi:hypothetical protein